MKVEFDDLTKKREESAKKDLAEAPQSPDLGVDVVARDNARVKAMEASGAPVRCVERLKRLIERKEGG